MFGIGFTEFIVIGIIAIVAVGPERLPEMARTIGRLAWELRRSWDEVRETVRTEMLEVAEPIDEIRKAGRNTVSAVRREADKYRDTARKAARDAERQVKNSVKDLEKSATGAKAAGDGDAAAVGKANTAETVTTAAAAGVAAVAGEGRNEPAANRTPGETLAGTTSEEVSAVTVGSTEESAEASAEAGVEDTGLGTVARSGPAFRSASARTAPKIEYFDLDGNPVPPPASATAMPTSEKKETEHAGA